MDPNLASAHYKLGILFQSENDFNSSLTYFEQAVKINPSFPEAECELAIELGRQGRLEDAREHFLKCFFLQKFGERTLLWTYMYLSDFSYAEQFLNFTELKFA